MNLDGREPRSQEYGIEESEAGRRKNLRRFVEDFTGKRIWLAWPFHVVEKPDDPSDDFRSQERDERLSSPGQGGRLGAGRGAPDTDCTHRPGGD